MTLFIIAAIGTVSSLVFWVKYAGLEGQDLKASGFKTVSTAALAILAALSGAPDWIVAGLALGAVGDYCLSRDGTSAFLAGMVAFALGHLAYAVAFFDGVGFDPLILPIFFWPVAALMIALVALTVFWIAPKAGGLAWPVRAYALVIAVMALAATLIPDGVGRGIIQLGALSFVASDLILALRLFIIQDPARRLIAARMLWPLYWGGQALILWGAVA